jgi:hypothetical protein
MAISTITSLIDQADADSHQTHAEELPDIPGVSDSERFQLWVLFEQASAIDEPVVVPHYLRHRLGGETVSFKSLSQCVSVLQQLPDDLRKQVVADLLRHVSDEVSHLRI